MSKVVDYIWEKREDALLFAASLFISVILFMQLQGDSVVEIEREFDVALEFTNESDDIFVIQATRRVKVKATGPQQLVESLDASKISAYVDLDNADVGRGRYRVLVDGPAEENLLFSSVQSYVQIEIESKVTVEFNVTVEPFGVPPGSFRYTGSTITPNKVLVSGPQSIMRDVLSVRAVLDLSRVQPNEEFSIDLEVLGEGNRPVPVVQAYPLKVTVNPAVTIGPALRKLFVNPMFVNQVSSGYRVISYTVTPNQIEAIGDSTEISKHSTISTRPIDLSGLTQATDFEVDIILPDGLTITGSTTVTVHVEVRRN